MTSKVILTSWIGVDLEKDKITSEYRVPSPLDYIDLLSPNGAITGVYGKRSINVYGGVATDSFREDGKIAVAVEFDVDRDIDADTKIEIGGKNGFKKVRTLNMLRLSKDAEMTLNTMWSMLLKGVVPEEEEQFPRMATSHPELIEKLRDLDLFKHIDLFIYPVYTPAGIIPFASCFDKKACSNFHAKRHIQGSLIPPV